MTVSLSGKIDSNNAAEKEQELFNTLNGERTDITLDVKDLLYISSAGLRIILKLRKESPDLKIINANNEVYEIFEMTGFTDMINISKAYKQYYVDGCTIVGQGAKGTVYRLNGDTVVKVYKNADSLPDIQKERTLAKKAFVLGIPTAISYDVAMVGEKYASVFELLDCKSFSEEIKDNPEKMDELIRRLAELLKQIHETNVKPEDMPSFKEKGLIWAEAAAPYLDESAAAKLKKLVSDIPETMNMLHCDFHTNNVMLQNDEAILIDMDTLSHGHPIFELANIYITYVGFGEVDKSIVENFLHLPYETAKTIWDKFLPIYLGKTDVKEIEDKIKLLSYARFIRHIARRNPNTEDAKKTIAYCKQRIEELIINIDSLVF